MYQTLTKELNDDSKDYSYAKPEMINNVSAQRHQQNHVCTDPTELKCNEKGEHLYHTLTKEQKYDNKDQSYSYAKPEMLTNGSIQRHKQNHTCKDPTEIKCNEKGDHLYHTLMKEENENNKDKSYSFAKHEKLNNSGVKSSQQKTQCGANYEFATLEPVQNRPYCLAHLSSEEKNCDGPNATYNHLNDLGITNTSYSGEGSSTYGSGVSKPLSETQDPTYSFDPVANEDISEYDHMKLRPKSNADYDDYDHLSRDNPLQTRNVDSTYGHGPVSTDGDYDEFGLTDGTDGDLYNHVNADNNHIVESEYEYACAT